ncbi:unnamed protein product [Paramecium primaurelia]|uniref:Uncharacterized protein n=1 Tax=Paramecium primaurelia TaxID=5886 RepID=A0A8S1PAW2_PARPR|nr:unnamed protein product [Paramecium primaurelia]
MIDGWQDYLNNVNFYTCGGSKYFGISTNNWIAISRIFLDLEPHSHIIVEAEFHIIGNQTSPTFQIDEQSISYYSVISSQDCGNSQPEYLKTFSITYSHNRRNVWTTILNESGFQILENICFPFCGDKLILEEYEDCDDGNEQTYDGCFQCKFKCIEDCNICEKGQCILKCQDGYEFVNNSCLSVCGDQIITKEENCDNGNLRLYNGQNCFDCSQGTCLECNYQNQLLISNQCKYQLNCGDGLLQESEDCDDGNYLAEDGCKDCLIQQNWICITITRDTQSQCSFVQAPILQKFKRLTLIRNYNFEISNIEKKNWNSNLYIIKDVGSNVSFGEFIISIEIQQLLEFRPVLKIIVNQTVSNIDDVILDVFEKSITLKYTKFLDEKQMDYSQNLKNLNKYMIFSLSGITGINLLFGSVDLFFEIMAISQFQQYLKYINQQYPQNMEIYFSVYDNYLASPGFHLFSSNFLVFQYQYCEGKFNAYNQNTNLIINLSSPILKFIIFLQVNSIISNYILYFVVSMAKMALYNWIFCLRYFNNMTSLSLYINPKVIFKCSQSFYNICLELIKLKRFMIFKDYKTNYFSMVGI